MFSAESIVREMSRTRPLVKQGAALAAGRKLWLVALACVSIATAKAQTSEEREYAIKAGFLYSFFSYIEWPEQAGGVAGSPFVIGILGENSFGSALETLRGKMVKGRFLEIRQVADPAQLGGYHLLFVSASEQSRLREILERTKNTPTLTVGEVAGFLREGGVINLVPSRNRIQIEISPAAAEQAGLTISSQLLKLAQIARR